MQTGATLVELVVAVLMVGLILAAGIPSFKTLIQNNRITAEANRFLTSMMLARSEAVKRGVQTTMAAKGGDWVNGWQIQDGGMLLRDEDPLDPSLTLISAGPNLTSGYDADGSLTGGAGAVDSLDLCDSTRVGETGRRILVAATGRVSVNRALVCP